MIFLKHAALRQCAWNKRKKKSKKLYSQVSYPKLLQKMPLYFLGKKVLYKIIDDGKPVWYERIVTEVLDNDEADQEWIKPYNMMGKTHSKYNSLKNDKKNVS